MLVLAIESSCDDTAAAVVEANRRRVLANRISSQHDIHRPFGGIVPELASRRHIEMIQPVVAAALQDAGLTLDDIQLLAATQGPGLVGSLLVGFTFAKAVALARHLPCVGVNHLAGHLLACLLEPLPPDFPYTALLVSGGNTALFRVEGPAAFVCMGRTLDDAAGEAFDKVAKMLGLGYPGGPLIARLAENGDPTAFNFPRAWLDKEQFAFSFSGLKTAVRNVLPANGRPDAAAIPDICASFQAAMSEVLVEKSLLAARENGHKRVVLGGGVAANQHLRAQLAKRCREKGLSLFLPSPIFCTDNAAMIAMAGFYAFQAGEISGPDADAYSRAHLH